MDNVEDNINDLTERMAAYTARGGITQRFRPELRRMMEEGVNSYQHDLYNEYPAPPPVPALTSPLTVEEMEILLASSLVKLSPTELKHTRNGNYPIFRNNSLNLLRLSFLFDEIPFDLKEFNRDDLRHCFRVYYHDDKIDWGEWEGWDVPSTRNNNAKGLVFINRKRGYAHCLEGRLCFIPPDEEQQVIKECYHLDSDDEEEECDSEDEYLSGDSECASDHYDDDNEEYDSQDEYLSEEGSSVARHSGAEDEQQSNDECMENNEEEVSEESELGSEHSSDSDWNQKTESFKKRYSQKLYSDWTLFHFDELHFNEPNNRYKEASWYASGSECDFGLINSQDNEQDADDGEREDADANDGEREDRNTVTLFIANESMAFARGDRQHFVSLERPNNYGSECNSHYNSYLGYNDHFRYEENDMHRMNVLQRMQAYRSTTWICKLCPTDMILPDDAAHLIWEYWQTGPPPYLFVERGDLLLLARKKEDIPDPDLPEVLKVTLTREHVVLARLADFL